MGEEKKPSGRSKKSVAENLADAIRPPLKPSDEARLEKIAERNLKVMIKWVTDRFKQ